MKHYSAVLTILALAGALSCSRNRADVGRLVENYALVTIPAPDLTGITDNGKEVLRLYRKAADEVDKIYWQQYFGDGEAFLSSLTDPSESTTVLGTALTESRSFPDTATGPKAPVSIRRT